MPVLHLGSQLRFVRSVLFANLLTLLESALPEKRPQALWNEQFKNIGLKAL
jgi:hypothetical protein